MINANEYFRIHNWLNYHYGKADKCENDNCISVNPKRFERALIKGRKHERKKENYIMLCSSCHRRYDYTDEQRKKQSEARRGKLYSDEYRLAISKGLIGVNNKAVIKLDKNENMIKEYESVSIAAKNNDILQTSISNVLTNRSKTAGGFKWVYKQTN